MLDQLLNRISTCGIMGLRRDACQATSEARRLVRREWERSASRSPTSPGAPASRRPRRRSCSRADARRCGSRPRSRRACPRRPRDRLSAEHRLAEPPHRHEPHDRVRLRHRRDHPLRRPPDLGRARRRPRARTPAVHRRDRGRRELEQELIEAMHDRGVDGIVLASMYTRKIAVPKTLTDGPAVLLNAVPANRSTIPSVIPDEVEAGRTVARVLLDAGHRDGICLIGAAPPNRVPKDSLAAVQRLQGITEGPQRRRRRRRRGRSLRRLAAGDRLRRDATAAREDHDRPRSSASTTDSRSAPTRHSPTQASTSRRTCRSCRSTTT